MPLEIAETIKEHPKTTAAIAVVGVIVLYLLFHGGSSSSTAATGTADDSGDVQAATDLYTAQLQAAQTSAGYAAAAQVNQSNNSVTLQEASLAGNITNTANQLQAGIDLANINAQQQEDTYQISAEQQTTDETNTLASQVDEASLNAQVQEQQISSATTLGTANIVANALVQESNNQTQVGLAEVGAQENATAAAETVATQSWISKIF